MIMEPWTFRMVWTNRCCNREERMINGEVGKQAHQRWIRPDGAVLRGYGESEQGSRCKDGIYKHCSYRARRRRRRRRRRWHAPCGRC